MGKREGFKKKKRVGDEGPRVAPVGDARFARIHNDPRFQRLPKHKAKVPIDSRFSSMFHDKGFLDPSDKRGRSKKSGTQEQLLRRYYSYEEEDAKQGTGDILRIGKSPATGNKRKDSGRKNVVTKPGVEREEELEDEPEEDAGEKRAEAGNGLALEEIEDDSDEESLDAEDSAPQDDAEEGISSSSSSSSDSESDAEDTSEVPEEEKVPTTEKETRRLALMNMDWNHIRAVDLLVVLRSFQPKGGFVESVTIYPSEFGIEQMKQEEVQGPQSVFRDDDSEEEDGPDSEKLRAYEKAKLRYYYAVAECDSVDTAARIYNSCDGLEYEKTSNTLDLRFIPDDMNFARPPRDTAKDVPEKYKPVEFETKALQHSNVKLTWDDDEPLRAKALRRKFNPDELNEMDFRDYLGSSSGSESEEILKGDYESEEEHESRKGGSGKEKARSKYLSLLAGTEAAETKGVSGKAEKGNIEIKFHTGLDELSEKLMEKARKDKNDETVWEAYLRKKREKKKLRKKNSNAASDSEASDGDGDPGVSSVGVQQIDDSFFSHTEDPFDDPFFQNGENSVPTKGSKGSEAKEGKKIHSKAATREEEKKKRKEDLAREKKEEERRKAELEMLMMDDHMVQNEAENPNSQNTKDSRKKQKKKGGKGKAEEQQDKLASSANYDDPRFACLFTSHHYAIDPTDPHFKKSAVTLSTIAEKQRNRMESSISSKNDHELHMGSNEGGTDLEAGKRKRKAELSSLVWSLKSKAQTIGKGGKNQN